MKTTTLTLSALAVLLGLAACNKENFNPSSSDPQDGNTVKVTLSANQENEAGTRAEIGSTGSDKKTTILWSENDKLSVFDGADKNIAFSITNGTGETSGTFEGTVSKTSESYVALYPYQSKATIDESRNTISNVALSSTQTAVSGSFDPEAALMTAVGTTDGSLAFKNAVGYIKVTPQFACKKITLTSNSSSINLAGTVSISLAEDGTPTASVTADASNSVSISGTIAANTAYYIAVLPATLTDGFTLVLTDSDNNTISKTSSKALEIKRNTITDLGTISNTIPYVTFSADSEQTFLTEEGGEGDFDGTFEYSVGNGKWTDIAFNEEVQFGGAKGDLRLRGKSDYGTTKADGDNYIIIGFSDANVKVKCSGDIRTLIDSTKNYSTASTANARFKNLFYDCKALTSAPTLPATELAEGCYEYMFHGCTALETAPELPAETLAESCYSAMFWGCTSLKTAPKLPAKKLAERCYSYMFNGCTALENAPELPAETLAVECYNCMFYRCTALKTAPELPAKTLANLCYYAMFSSCTALQSDIELPAEALAQSCYSAMFMGCTSLTKITLRATSTAEYALNNWLKETVASDGKTRTICKNKAFTLSEGTDYPSGWTVTDLTD